MRKALSIIAKVFLGILAAIVIFLFISIAPVDRTLPQDQPFYQVMMRQIDSIVHNHDLQSEEGFYVGYGKASITPAYLTSTAGYVKRKGAHFNAIRDSIFVRTIVVEKSNVRAAIVSLDMLIVPPVLYKRLEVELSGTDFSIDQLYLGATHTHNSIGQWDDHFVGEIYAGDFDPQLVDFLVKQIVSSLEKAENNLQPGDLFYGTITVGETVRNRLIKGGPVDSLLHLIEIVRPDGTKGIFTSYSAHATCMSSSDLRLSRDYPGALVDRLENYGYDFAMFMAGAVGSHAPITKTDGDEKIEMMGSILFEAAIQAERKPVAERTVLFHRIPLLLGKQQIKFLPNWRVRQWLSLKLMGEYTPSLTVLQLGDVVILGTPCDFSGMLTGPLYRKAAEHNLHALVTSFNGGYIGYITPDEYYDLEKYETQTMSWYGPGNGSYMQTCLNRMIERVGQ